MYEKLNDEKAFPVEVFAKEHECSAQGFLTNKGFEKLEYDVEYLRDFLAPIMDDMNLENPTGEYTLDEVSILMVYNI